MIIQIQGKNSYFLSLVRPRERFMSERKYQWLEPQLNKLKHTSLRICISYYYIVVIQPFSLDDLIGSAFQRGPKSLRYCEVVRAILSKRVTPGIEGFLETTSSSLLFNIKDRLTSEGGGTS